MNDTAMAVPVPVPRQRCKAMAKVRSRDDVPGWVAELLSDMSDDMPKRQHLYDPGHEKFPFDGRVHWKALVQYAHLPPDAKAIAAWSLEQRLPDIWPTWENISTDSGVARRTIPLAVDVLEWLGFVDVTHTKAGNRYFLTFPLVDVTRLIKKSSSQVKPVQRALAALVRGDEPTPADAALLDLSTLRPVPSVAADPGGAAESCEYFAQAWALFPAAYGGKQSTVRRVWAATVAEMVKHGDTPSVAGAVLLGATKSLMWRMDQKGTPDEFRPRPRGFFAWDDGGWRDHLPGAVHDPNRSPLLVDGVEVW